MSASFKKYCSLFLLSIFLFATAEKGVHDILHLGDSHCHSLSEKHYHNLEHHCYVCDFCFSFFEGDFTSLKTPAAPNPFLVPVIFTEGQYAAIPAAAFLNKGPPALV
ncbi:MAG: hypothetical protein HKL88_01020 [Bacteroidia bacterium]|jgi:hypothetical protein|nr:hypothetical protein [Bacteroidia bacterium]